MKRLLVIGWLILAVIGATSAQEKVDDVEALLEANDILPTEDGYEEMVATLLQLQASPIDLNRAGFDTLKMLFFLSDSQIDNILHFRKKYVALAALEELLLVDGFSESDLANIRPFVYVGDTPTLMKQPSKNAHAKLSHEIIARGRISWPRQEGYKMYKQSDFKTQEQYEKKRNNRFKGIPLGTLVKYKTNLGKIAQAGVTLENDPGEPYFTRHQKYGFDFVSFHLFATPGKRLSTIALGDFRMQWGQGLLMWSGFSAGKSGQALGCEKSARGIAPYTSTDENNYLRGIAVGASPIRNVTTELFLSYKKTDGSILETDSLTDDDMMTASLYQSGYHRNNNECEKKHTLKELTTGFSAHWNTPVIRWGVNAVYYDFSPPIDPGTKPYQQYNDNGENRFLTSIDYKTGWGNLYLFGETAYAANRGWATVNGLRFSGSGKVALCVLYRRYGKRYISHYASAFGEYSNTSNEEGVYIGADISPLRNLKISLYHDRFRFLAPRYNAFIPDHGHETMLTATFSHGRFGHSLRYKLEKKPEDIKEVTVGSTLRRREDFRYQFDFQVSPRWEFRTRCDASVYRKKDVKDNGYIISQDIIYTAPKSKFKGYLRCAYFNTDSYNAKVYSYENTVLYGYSFPAYYDRGWRTYVNLNWKPQSKITLYAKLGMTYYPGREFSGSSLTKVEGNKRFDATLQVRIKL